MAGCRSSLDDEIIQDWLDPEIPADQLLVVTASALAVPYSEQLRECEVKPLKGDGPGLILPA